MLIRKFIPALLAAVIGVVMGVICGLFGQLLEHIEAFHSEHYIMLLPFLGLIGVIILFMYRKISPNSEQGLNLAIAYNMGKVDDAGQIKDFGHAQKIGKYPKAYVFMKLFSNALMLLFGASTGKEGTIATCGAAVGDYTARIFKCRRYSRILLVTGISAAVAGLFGTPLGGVFFALEFSVAGILFYKALIPALISAYTANYIAGACGLHAFKHIITVDLNPGLKEVVFIVICSVLFGIVGRLFTVALRNTKKLYSRYVKNRYVGIFAAGTIMAAVFIFVHNGRYGGTGSLLLSGLFSGSDFYMYDFALKIIFTVICVSVGYSGGEMMPLIAIGALFGATLSSITGLPYELMIVMGAMAVYSGATNTLLAPIFIGAEMFGTSGILYIAAACLIAFAVNCNDSVYSLQGNIPSSVYGIFGRKQ